MTNAQRVEVRGSSITYFVNDVAIGTFEHKMNHDSWQAGTIGHGKQKVCFSRVEISQRRVELPDETGRRDIFVAPH